MNEKKKLLIGRLREKIKEIIRKEMEEGTGTSSVAGPSTPYAFSKSGKGNERAAVASTNYELVKEKNEDHKKDDDKPVIAVVDTEKSENDVKPRGITRSDADVLLRKQHIASSLGRDDEANHYGRLLALVNKHLKK